MDANNKNSGIGSIILATIEATVESGDTVSIDESELSESPAMDVYASVNAKLQQNRAEQEMETDVEHIVHGGALTHIGIKLAPTGSYMSDGQGNAVTAAKLEPSVESTPLYLDFLKTLTSADVAKSTLFADVATSLKDRILKTVGSRKDPEGTTVEQSFMLHELGMDALRTWDEIEEQYERLDIHTHSTAELAIYPEYWGQGILPEYIEASQKGYIKDIGFGPAEWAEDMSPEGLSERWNAALDCMAITGVTAPDSELYSQIKQHLDASLVTSIDSMERALSSADHNLKQAMVEWEAHGSKPYNVLYENGALHYVVHESPEVRHQNWKNYLNNNLAVLRTVRQRFSIL